MKKYEQGEKEIMLYVNEVLFQKGVIKKKMYLKTKNLLQNEIM